MTETGPEYNSHALYFIATESKPDGLPVGLVAK